MRQLPHRRFLSKTVLVWLIVFWIIMDLNLSGLSTSLLSENHLMAFSDLAISIFKSNLTDLGNDDTVLSSAKLWADTFLMQKKKSFKCAWNKIDPTTKSYETPEIMSLISLLTLFMYKYISGHYIKPIRRKLFN